MRIAIGIYSEGDILISSKKALAMGSVICDSTSRIRNYAVIDKATLRNLPLVPIAMVGDTVILVPRSKLLDYTKDKYKVPPLILARRVDSDTIFLSMMHCRARSGGNKIFYRLEEVLHLGLSLIHI